MNQKKTGNAVRLHVFVDNLYHLSKNPLTVIIDKSKTLLDLKNEFAAKKYYAVEEQHWVINGTYCHNEFEIRVLTEKMTPFNKGFVAFLLMMTTDEKNELLEYYGSFVERRYRHVNLFDRWHEPEPVLMIIADVFDPAKPEPVVGWNCTKCTFFNKPYLKCCDACGCYRPQDFHMPEKYYYTKEDKIRMNEELEREDGANQGENESGEKIEQDKIDHLRKLKKMSTENLIFSTYREKCQLCGVEYEPGETIILRKCFHVICKKCLKKYLTTTNDPEVKCFDVNCVSRIEDQEIQGILNEEEYEIYQQLSLRTAENKIPNTFHCKTPNCIGWVVFDDYVLEFICQVCQKTNCILCKAIHKGQTCQEYQSKAPDDEYVKRNKEFVQNRFGLCLAILAILIFHLVHTINA